LRKDITHRNDRMYILERRGVTAGVVGVARRERVVKLERVRALS